MNEANDDRAPATPSADTDKVRAHVLDVRPLITAGSEPFLAIMSAVDGLAPQQALRLIAPFKPVPLFAVMARRGYDSDAQALPSGEGWEIVFTPVSRPRGDGPQAADASEALFWPEPADSLDLTGIAPPHPMTRILAKLRAMQPGEVLFAVLDREPAPLFEELARRGHEWIGDFSRDRSSYRMMIRHGVTDA